MAVIGVVGPHGEGKTYLMVDWAFSERERDPDVAVYSNIPSLHLPGKGPVYYMKRWPEDFAAARDGLVLIDEINLVMPGRLWERIPPEMLYAIAYLRKFRLRLMWTAQHIDRVDKVVREITTELWVPANYRRFGFFAYHKMQGPKLDKPAGWGFRSARREVDAAYDTYETVDVASFLARRSRK